MTVTEKNSLDFARLHHPVDNELNAIGHRNVHLFISVLAYQPSMCFAPGLKLTVCMTAGQRFAIRLARSRHSSAGTAHIARSETAMTSASEAANYTAMGIAAPSNNLQETSSDFIFRNNHRLQTVSDDAM